MTCAWRVGDFGNAALGLEFSEDDGCDVSAEGR